MNAVVDQELPRERTLSVEVENAPAVRIRDAVRLPRFRLRGLHTQVRNFMRGEMPEDDLRDLEDISQRHSVLQNRLERTAYAMRCLERRETLILHRNGFLA